MKRNVREIVKKSSWQKWLRAHCMLNASLCCAKAVYSL